MKHNKSPGLDGILTEFYQAFWPLLGNLLTEVFNESRKDISQTHKENSH